MPREAVSGLGRDGQRREAESVEMRQPGGAIGEARLGFRRQTGNQHGGQSAWRAIGMVGGECLRM